MMRPAPELHLVLLAGLAEAREAERAELGGVLGVVRAPDRALGVELPQAVPADHGIRIRRRRRPRHFAAIVEDNAPAFNPASLTLARGAW